MILKTLKSYWIILGVGICSQLTCLALGNERAALSSLVGTSLAALIQYWAVAVTRAILQKKSVAIASTLIVLKYAIFGIILMFLGSGFKLHPLGFFIGFMTLIPNVIYVSQVEYKSHSKSKGSN